MLIRFWGTRGSIPSPGPDTARYGGNTTCIEVVTDSGHAMILDAGTGIRKLGRRITAESSPGGQRSLHLLLSHCHWDHVQGLPFFEPLRNKAVDISVRVPPHLISQADRILQAQMDTLFFPITRADLSARIAFQSAEESEILFGARLSTCPVDHPGGAVAYRVDADGDAGRSVVMAPDSELVRGGLGDSPLNALAAGAKILIHDAMYTESEYAARKGWGHSTHLAAVELALRQKVQLLVLFHHHPDRTDAQVDVILEESRAAAGAAGDLLVVAAYEGLELQL